MWFQLNKYVIASVKKLFVSLFPICGKVLVISLSFLWKNYLFQSSGSKQDNSCTCQSLSITR